LAAEERIMVDMMDMEKVDDEAFRPYGRVMDLDVQAFVRAIAAHPAAPQGQTVYEPSVAEFEALPLFQELQAKVYGGLPIEFGHCSGFNEKLNAVEYHRSSEIDIAATDLVLMVGRQQDIDYKAYTYDTSRIKCFFVPAGTAVELYATTLHFAPCGINGSEFRCGVVLPQGTNAALKTAAGSEGEARLLFAVNKWLIAHADSGLGKDGAWLGLKGENITLR
jgi:hypothetical protein